LFRLLHIPEEQDLDFFFLTVLPGFFSVLEISFVIGRIWDKESSFAFAAQPFLEQRPAGRNQVFYSSIQGRAEAYQMSCRLGRPCSV
jgi:hypothetical protein